MQSTEQKKQQSRSFPTSGNTGGTSRFLGDVSGAFADLGTFLPLVIGLLAVLHLDGTGLLVGFGLAALAAAIIYRAPIPIQPMKIVAAMAIAGGLSAAELMASGLLIGIALTLLALSGAITHIARIIPQSVLTGIQLGIGIQLALTGFGLISGEVILGTIALTGLLVLLWSPAKPLAGLLVIAGASAWLLMTGSEFPAFTLQLQFPQFHMPDIAALLTASYASVIPQLALTLTNAVLLTAVIAVEYFPESKDRITPRNLALSSGLMNVLLAPFGAIPMCHGAGGLVVQHKFGARTLLTPVIFGITCLALGLLAGADAAKLFAVIPLAAVGALLVVAGGELAISKRLFDGRPSCMIVIALTAIICVTLNVAIGLVVGIIAEHIRSTIARHIYANNVAEKV